MRLFFALLFCAAALPVHAAAPDPDPVPESIWQRSDDGSGIHQQSELRCPVRAGPFRLTGLVAIDGFGLDVACTYDRAAGDRITLYLTQAAPDHGFAAHLKVSLESIVMVDPDARPLPGELPRFEPAPAAWLGALFGYDDRPLRSGVWLSDVSGWTLKFRATYETEREQEILAVMGELAKTARASAAPHLAACAAAAVPERRGVHTNEPAVLAERIAEAAIDMAGGAAPAPTWCVETPITDGRATLMFWRSAAGDHDRISLMTIDAPLIFECAAQSASVYRLEVPFNGLRVVFGFFDGRPSADTLLPVIRDIIAGNAEPVGVYDPRRATMEVPR
jgi:hypothetical protein